MQVYTVSRAAPTRSFGSKRSLSDPEKRNLLIGRVGNTKLDAALWWTRIT